MVRLAAAHEVNNLQTLSGRKSPESPCFFPEYLSIQLQGEAFRVEPERFKERENGLAVRDLAWFAVNLYLHTLEDYPAPDRARRPAHFHTAI